MKEKTNKTKALMVAVATVLTAACSQGTSDVTIPNHEWRIIGEVSREYGLDSDGVVLLAAIRCHENGLAGLEFGIGGPMDSGHPAHRFAQGVTDRHAFNEASFRCQARWAAGTIRKRYHGNLLAFARVYCPHNAWKWYVGVASLMYRIVHSRNRKGACRD